MTRGASPLRLGALLALACAWGLPSQAFAQAAQAPSEPVGPLALPAAPPPVTSSAFTSWALAQLAAGRAGEVTLPAELPASNALGLGEVLSQVQRSFPVLLAAQEEEALAEADVRSAKGAFDIAWRTRATAVPLGAYPTVRLDSVLEQPTPLWGVTVFGGYRLGVGNFADYDGKATTNDLGEVRAGAAIPLWRNGPIDRRRANIERAELGRSVAKLTVSQQRIEIVRAASVRYWDWVAAGRRRTIFADLLRIAVDRDAGLARRVLEGDLPEIERVDNERAILQRKGQLAQAERTLVQQGFELGLYLRDDQGRATAPDRARLPGAIDEPAPLTNRTREAEVADALARRPEVARLVATRKQASVELAWAQNQLAPALDLQAVVSADLGAGSDKRGKPELEVGLLIDIPLMVNVAGGRVDAANATLRRIDQQTRFARERVETDVRDALNALEIAEERVKLARQEVEVARRLELGEQRKLELGDSTLLIVNLREQATAEARLREVDALTDWQKARAAYDAATARSR